MTDTHSTNPAIVAAVAAYWTDWLGYRRERDRLPGVQAAVMASGEMVATAEHGLADVESTTPVTSRSLFRVASHSKTFTSVAIARLVERGALRYDDRIADHLDWAANGDIGGRTIGELLAHGGGVIRDGTDGNFWQLQRSFPDRDALIAVATASDVAVIPANERFKYSNIAYGVLGLVIEAVTGSDYATHVHRDVVDQLGLADTGAEYDPQRADDYVTGYTSLNYADRRLPIDPIDTRALASATGFYSTASDLVRYFSAHTIGIEGLLSDESKRRMQRPGWPHDDVDSYGLGLGCRRVAGRNLVGHGGGFPGQLTKSQLDPLAGIAVSVLTNAIDGFAQLYNDVFWKLLADVTRDGDERPDRLPVDALCGRYAGLWGVLDIARLGRDPVAYTPTLDDPTAQPQRLEVIDDTTLRVVDSNGYGSYGEPLLFDVVDGEVRSLRAGSGSTLYPLATWQRLVAAADRVPAESGLTP